MTWEELKQKINGMTEEQKQTDVTFYDECGNFFGVKSLEFADEETCDVLDHGHPFLTSL